MKEYNLTFLEAVEALEEEKCLGIESEVGCQYELEGSIVSYIAEKTTGIKLSPRSFLGKWRLVDPKPVKRKEVIEGVNWYRSSESGVTYPTAYPGEAWSKFMDKPPMKMTLEWKE